MIEPTGVAVYCLLARLADNDSRQCWPSLECIQTTLGIAKATAVKYLKKLEVYGLIRTDPSATDGRNRIYTLLPLQAGPDPIGSIFEPIGVTEQAEIGSDFELSSDLEPIPTSEQASIGSDFEPVMEIGSDFEPNSVEVLNSVQILNRLAGEIGSDFEPIDSRTEDHAPHAPAESQVSPLRGDAESERVLETPSSPPAEKGPAWRAPPHWKAVWSEFLTIYPPRDGDRKVSRGLERFERLAKAGEDLAAILDGARRYREWADEKGRTGTPYVKQIPTWLNDRTWEETLPTETRNANGNAIPRTDPPGGRPAGHRPDPRNGQPGRDLGINRPPGTGPESDTMRRSREAAERLQRLAWRPADPGGGDVSPLRGRDDRGHDPGG